MRLFIALELPEAFIPLLEQAGKAFSRHARKISLTPVENLHLTLRFLGDTPEGQAEGLRRLVRGLQGFSAQASLASYGSFAAPGGSTLWAGLDCDQAALKLARSVEEGARALGFPPENRPFLPHVTLARRTVLTKPMDQLAPFLPTHPALLPLGPLTLFESRLGPNGSTYTVLEQITGCHDGRRV